MDRDRVVAGTRVVGVDVARGLAGLIMIQGHAHHGWVHAEGKATAAYAATRVLGTMPLPAFFLLAGASLALRMRAAERKGEELETVRHAVVKRGLEVVLWGYATSFLFAAMDGWPGWDTVLRADVLHGIGLSIVVVAAAGIRRRPAFLVRAAGIIAVLVFVSTPFVARFSMAASFPEGTLSIAKYVVALWVDVPGVSRMPVVPLICWTCVGVVVSWWLSGAKTDNPADARVGASVTHVAILGLTATSLWWGGAWATEVMRTTFDGEFNRAHPAVWANLVDLTGRSLLVLALGLLVSRGLRNDSRLLRVLLLFGRNSLFIYVFHIPFCYGRVGALLRDVGMAEASVFVFLLTLVSGVAALAKVKVKR